MKWKIELLLDHTHLISKIADLRWQEFGYLCPEKTAHDFHKGLEAQINDHELPMAYVILAENQEFVGTFCLRKCDLVTHQHLSPWLGSVLVLPSMRNQGIGTFLVKNAEAIAKEKNFTSLYLFTPNKEAWYSHLGWTTLEHTFLRTIPITVMLKKLQ